MAVAVSACFTPRLVVARSLSTELFTQTPRGAPDVAWSRAIRPPITASLSRPGWFLLCVLLFEEVAAAAGMGGVGGLRVQRCALVRRHVRHGFCALLMNTKGC